MMLNKTDLFDCPLYACNVNDASSLWHNLSRQMTTLRHIIFCSSVVCTETRCFYRLHINSVHVLEIIQPNTGVFIEQIQTISDPCFQHVIYPAALAAAAQRPHSRPAQGASSTQPYPAYAEAAPAEMRGAGAATRPGSPMNATMLADAAPVDTDAKAAAAEVGVSPIFP
jgi:hypothetical protein